MGYWDPIYHYIVWFVVGGAFSVAARQPFDLMHAKAASELKVLLCCSNAAVDGGGSVVFVLPRVHRCERCKKVGCDPYLSRICGVPSPQLGPIRCISWSVVSIKSRKVEKRISSASSGSRTTEAVHQVHQAGHALHFSRG